MGMRFPAPIQTGRLAHPASCTMGAGFLSSGKAARVCTLLTSTEFKERVELYVFTPFWAFMAFCRVNFVVTFTLVLEAVWFAVKWCGYEANYLPV